MVRKWINKILNEMVKVVNIHYLYENVSNYFVYFANIIVVNTLYWYNYYDEMG